MAAVGSGVIGCFKQLDVARTDLAGRLVLGASQDNVHQVDRRGHGTECLPVAAMATHHQYAPDHSQQQIARSAEAGEGDRVVHGHHRPIKPLLAQQRGDIRVDARHTEVLRRSLQTRVIGVAERHELGVRGGLQGGDMGGGRPYPRADNGHAGSALGVHTPSCGPRAL